MPGRDKNLSFSRTANTMKRRTESQGVTPCTLNLSFTFLSIWSPRKTPDGDTRAHTHTQR
jgi:hypothetical protein